MSSYFSNSETLGPFFVRCARPFGKATFRSVTPNNSQRDIRCICDLRRTCAVLELYQGRGTSFSTDLIELDPSTLGSVDVVLIAVKLWDTEAAAHAVSAIVGPTTAVLSLQNGVQKDNVLRHVFGTEPVLGGVCYIASTIARPGVVSHTAGDGFLDVP